MKKLFTGFTTLTILTLALWGIQGSLPALANLEMSGTTMTPFSDVKGTLHESDILNLAARGVIKGYANGTYQPDKTINRAEFLKILTEAKGDYSPSKDPSDFDILSPADLHLNDLNSKQWFVPYIRNALKNKIVSGYPDSTFKPENTINLAEALKMIFLTYKLPTVQFVKVPDHWYDYYTTGLDTDFISKTHLSAKRDIGKNITRGEMASLIVYFEAKAVAIPEVTPHYVDKPLILEKTFSNGSWTVSGYVMFSNGCYKPKTTVDVDPANLSDITLTVTEVSDELGMCQPTPQEYKLSFTVAAPATAQIKAVFIDGKMVTANIYDKDAEAGNPYSPLHLTQSTSSTASTLKGVITIDSCKSVTSTTTTYDGLTQEALINFMVTNDQGRSCSKTTSDWPVDVSIPNASGKATLFRAEVNGEPVQLMLQ